MLGTAPGAIAEEKGGRGRGESGHFSNNFSFSFFIKNCKLFGNTDGVHH